MNTRSAWSAIVVATILCAGCGGSSGTDTACSSAADCPVGQQCGPSGTCVSSCSADGGGCAEAGKPDSGLDVSVQDSGVDVSAKDNGVEAPVQDAGADRGKDAASEAAQDAAAGDAPASACTTDTQCDDADPCTKDTCVEGACQHSTVGGTHLTCKNYQCIEVDNTATACTDKLGCTAKGKACGEPTAGACPKSTCPFDAHDRYLDGKFPVFDPPYNDNWEYYYSPQTIHNPSKPDPTTHYCKFTSHSCDDDNVGGRTRGSTHVRALHKGVIDVTLTGMNQAQTELIKDTLNDPKGWVRAGLSFQFNTTFNADTDVQFMDCPSCPYSISGPEGSYTDVCGAGEFPHHDYDHNVIKFAPGSCFYALSSCSRWLINHEMGHALGLADRENEDLIGVSIMNHVHYYSEVWPKKELIIMVHALSNCGGKACLTP